MWNLFGRKEQDPSWVTRDRRLVLRRTIGCEPNIMVGFWGACGLFACLVSCCVDCYLGRIVVPNNKEAYDSVGSGWLAFSSS